MFEKNPFIIRMKIAKEEALNGGYRKVPCAREIRPMVIHFFNKCIRTKIKWNGENICWHIEHITDIAKYLAMNTRNYEKLTPEELTAMRKIFLEIKSLYGEAFTCVSHSEGEEFRRKVICISEIVRKNMTGMHDTEEDHGAYRDGMIFQSYENLWKIIHRVNTEWEELTSRGFSLNVFNDYWETFQYDRETGQEKTEEEKFDTFMKLLDGKMKFVPVYEHTPICFKVVDNDFEEVIVTKKETKYSKPYRLRQVGEDAEPPLAQD